MSLEQFNQIIQGTQSTDKATRDNGKYTVTTYSNSLMHIATTQLESMQLDQATTQMVLEYINSQQHPIADEHRLMAAIQLKNTIKKVYGSSASYSSYKKEQASEKSESAADGE